MCSHSGFQYSCWLSSQTAVLIDKGGWLTRANLKCRNQLFIPYQLADFLPLSPALIAYNLYISIIYISSIQVLVFLGCCEPLDVSRFLPKQILLAAFSMSYLPNTRVNMNHHICITISKIKRSTPSRTGNALLEPAQRQHPNILSDNTRQQPHTS